MSQIVFLLAVAALCLQTGNAIRCYECNSHNDSRCAMEKPPKELEKDCAELNEGSKYIMCRKITQTIEFEVNGLQPDSRVIRSCGWDETNYKGRCYQRSGFGGRQEVCSCLTDLCNHSSNFSSISILVMIFSLLSSVLMRILL
ncbi:UPAR/Ly6 domain-containing protein crok-like [Lycorma delicatula]|uniref:UPAR/Ly6 domain-containing protein crok-like n=1 Tax=Lycorma delicatula TaxID=130591 RepID=UPI003F5121EA